MMNRDFASSTIVGLLLSIASAGCSSGSSTSTPTNVGDAANGAEASSDGDTSTGPCAGKTCSGAHMTCDPADGACKLDGTTTAVGAPCSTTGADPACGTEPRATCNDLTNDGFPGGYCSLEPCTETQLCPVGSSCAALGGESNACFENCSSNADCRSGYECVVVDPHFTSGASHKVCFLAEYPCSADADCPASKPKCQGADGGMGVCK